MNAPEPTILFHDEQYVAIHKPPGLMVHRSALARPRLLALQWVRDFLGQQVFPVHRLDRATSGVLIFALNSEAASRLSKLIANHKVEKQYLAIARGFTEPSGCVDHPLQDEDQPPKEAVTDFETLATLTLPIPVSRYPEARYSLVSLKPRHGRRHQLRKHMVHLRHPIVGDTVHGDGKHNRLFRVHLGLHRLMLAAKSLAFTHPYTQAPICINWQPEPEFDLSHLRHRFESEALEPIKAWD